MGRCWSVITMVYNDKIDSRIDRVTHGVSSGHVDLLPVAVSRLGRRVVVHVGGGAAGLGGRGRRRRGRARGRGRGRHLAPLCQPDVLQLLQYVEEGGPEVVGVPGGQVQQVGVVAAGLKMRGKYEMTSMIFTNGRKMGATFIYMCTLHI
jgi:hypothetical protein